MSAPSPLAACPFCHTSLASLPHEAIRADDSWVCARCGQEWTAHRLETVAAYAAWLWEHQRV